MSIDKEKLGLDKIIKNSLDSCDLYILQKGDKVLLLYVFDKGDYFYFKIMPATIGKWEDCENALYYSFGLFGFSKKNEYIEDKIKEKIEVLESYGLA
ncbi:MAG: hypothetical protein QXY68_01985 [Saccharolobus sp.]